MGGHYDKSVKTVLFLRKKLPPLLLPLLLLLLLLLLLELPPPPEAAPPFAMSRKPAKMPSTDVAW